MSRHWDAVSCIGVGIDCGRWPSKLFMSFMRERERERELLMRKDVLLSLY